MPPVVFGVRWDGRGRAVVLAIVAAALAALIGASLFAGAGARTSTVIVLGEGDAKAAARAVERAGGAVQRRLDLVDGVVANVPAGELASLTKAPGVRSVTEDRVLSTSSTDIVDTDASMLAGPGVTLADVRRAIRSDQVPASGRGIDIALIDSGVMPVGALAAPGKVVNGPDVSPDAFEPALRHLDALGHGTHLAGIIAGEGGIAPDARIVNVKAADRSGETTLLQLLIAMEWTIRHRDTGGRNIRVITLAVGADSGRPYDHDPLALAAERAWQEGIVVVTAAGNDGEERTGLDLPAADPFLLAVGATQVGDPANPDDDVVASWSSRGDRRRNPDVVAPGVSIVSQRVEGSVIDLAFPEARVGEDGFRRTRVFEDWLGRRWSGRRWSAELWTGRRWSGVKWSGVKW